MTPRLKGFFCGGGLMLLGMQQAGVEIVESNEIDPVCCDTLKKNFGHKVNRGDITKKLVHDGSPDADVYGFTFPCDRYSPISAVHDCHTGDELYLHAQRHTTIRPPELFVLENVPGLLKFPVVMETMTRLPGYFVKVVCPVSADYWVPQKRDRVIIFASRRPFNWSQPRRGRQITLKSILEKDPQVSIPPYVYKRLRGAYRDLPIISDPARGDLAPCCVAHYGKDRSTRLVRDKRFKKGVRPYTVREYARLQGVPDSYTFCGTQSEQYTQIGNGVEVNMARWVGRNIVRYFNS